MIYNILNLTCKGYRINQYAFFFSFLHLYYNFPWKYEHECTPSVHDKSSTGNLNLGILLGAALYMASHTQSISSKENIGLKINPIDEVLQSTPSSNHSSELRRICQISNNNLIFFQIII